MNKRIINSVLSKKFSHFLDSIDNAKVKELVSKNTIITGGCIASMLQNERPKDFDLYFTNFETVKAVAEYYSEQFSDLHPKLNNPPSISCRDGRVKIHIQSAGVVGENTDDSQYTFFEGRPLEEGMEYVEKAVQAVGDADDFDGDIIPQDKKTPYRPVFLTSNAITLSNQVQLILRFYGDPDEIHKNFDFVHAFSHWESKTKTLTLYQPALESILAKQLFYVGSLFPVSSFIRVRKFLKRGWHINAGSMLKICLQISQLDLLDIDVLEDQLTGVDSAYFKQIIDALKEKRAKDPSFELGMPYLATIVDKMFQ